MVAISGPANADPLGGNALYEDVRLYDSFGPHRYGSPGAARAWSIESCCSDPTTLFAEIYT